MSLTNMARTYVFLPLAFRWARALTPQRAAYAATVVTFLAVGLWHGDGINYLIFGLYHGVLLSLHQAFLHATRKQPLFRKLRRQRWLAVPAWALTFALVSIGWYPFVFTLPQLVGIITRSGS
jgi:membrane protein involved in D-alanine export